MQSGGMIRLTMVQEGSANRVMVNPMAIQYALDVPEEARKQHGVKA
jgi:hypothetical protein